MLKTDNDILASEMEGSFGVGFSIQEEAVDVAKPAPSGAYCHPNVIYLLP